MSERLPEARIEPERRAWIPVTRQMRAEKKRGQVSILLRERYWHVVFEVPLASLEFM